MLENETGEVCETCQSLIEGGTPFSRYCDKCLDDQAGGVKNAIADKLGVKSNDDFFNNHFKIIVS